ncbi:uncharacterized protein LOC121873924 [Homarus americanus]|uniref:uncharacterized protein LOC121873924 n=1 Tax=Homarus americanus TaxID=6706 RepID=UPI001C4906D5|nr:uncharacterized protein LOC121873924 [Homarus americanus]
MKQLENEVQLRQLVVTQISVHEKQIASHPARESALVLPFDESDVDGSFVSFENTKILKWIEATNTNTFDDLKLNFVYYIVNTSDRRKDSLLVHINLMKVYVERKREEDSAEGQNAIPSAMCNTSLVQEMINAPATFQRVFSYTIQDLEGNAAYLDDLVVTADSWGEHLTSLNALLDRLQGTRFTINLAKSTFGMATVVYVGHLVGQRLVRNKTANVEAIQASHSPATRKALMRFWGMVGYYSRFCSNFSTVAAPLTKLNSPKTPFLWTPV